MDKLALAAKMLENLAIITNNLVALGAKADGMNIHTFNLPDILAWFHALGQPPSVK